MHSTRLAARRSAAQAGLLATVGAVALVLTALIVGLTGYLDFSAAASTRDYFASASPTARGVQVETKLGDDPAAQSASADQLFAHEFDGTSVEITRTLTDFPLAAALVDTDDSSGSGSGSKQLSLADGREARITPASDAGLTDYATLVDGAWPAAASGTDGNAGTADNPIPGALQADAARQLGLKVGDVLELGATGTAKSVEIVGTWLPKDAGDPRWFADSGATTGNAHPAGDGTESFGPLMVDEAVLPSLGPVPFVHWTIIVDANRVAPGDLAQLGQVATNLRQAIIDDDTIGKGDILVSGSLADTTTTVQRGLNSARGVTPVGILLAGLIGLIALVQLARLLSLARRPENALLRSRGASAQWLTATGIGEAVVVAVIGCALGYAAGSGALVGLFGVSAMAYAPWEFAALIAVAVLAIYGTTAFLDSIRLAQRDAVDDSGRTRAAATIGTAVLAVAAAAVAVWQSLLYGSPIVTTAQGGTTVDPLAVVAPTLALIAIALVLLVVFGPLTAAWQRIATRRPRLQPSYSARQVARGIGSYAVAVLVVSLAIGGVVIASGYSGSWRSLGDRNAELTAGADARITLTQSDLPLAGTEPVTGADFLGVAGVTDAVPVLSTPVTIGDNDSGRLTAIPAADIGAVVNDAEGTVDVATLESTLSGFEQRGVELPAGTTSLSLDATLSVIDPTTGEPATTKGYAGTTLWFQDSEGGISSTALPQLFVDSLEAGKSLTTPLTVKFAPSEATRWLVAIDYSVRADSNWLEMHYGGLVATTPSGAQPVALDTLGWMDLQYSAFANSTLMDADGLTLGLPGAQDGRNRLRMMDVGAQALAAGGVRFESPRSVPVVVTQEFADAYDLAVDDKLDLRFSGTGLVVTSTVAAIAPVLPGAPSPNQALADLNQLNDYLLRASPVVPRANQVWLSAGGPTVIDSEALDTSLPDGATIVTPANATDNSFAAPAELALWIAAIGCLLLAVISLGAVALTVARARRGEVVVLRAVGISARQQSRSRLGEFSAIVLISVVFGLVGGLLVSALTSANLARSAVLGIPSGLQATLAFAVIPGAGLLLIGLVIMLGIAVVSASRVRRQALDTDERLETR
ncbi:ABC transporter permease [Leifsonia bigeumensis]|uniref:ABC transporter permease n=1 Tax=Leifsonella bigeumensis TaxID=433643 RepID=A0ABP7FB89_9MICO